MSVQRWSKTKTILYLVLLFQFGSNMDLVVSVLQGVQYPNVVVPYVEPAGKETRNVTKASNQYAHAPTDGLFARLWPWER